MTNLTTHLTEIGSSNTAGSTRYMSEGRDCGSLADTFGADVAHMKIGKPHGADDSRACYAWWPVTIRGEVVGELRDDAAGYTFHDAMGGQ